MSDAFCDCFCLVPGLRRLPTLSARPGSVLGLLVRLSILGEFSSTHQRSNRLRVVVAGRHSHRVCFITATYVFTTCTHHVLLLHWVVWWLKRFWGYVQYVVALGGVLTVLASCRCRFLACVRTRSHHLHRLASTPRYCLPLNICVLPPSFCLFISSCTCALYRLGSGRVTCAGQVTLGGSGGPGTVAEGPP